MIFSILRTHHCKEDWPITVRYFHVAGGCLGLLDWDNALSC